MCVLWWLLLRFFLFFFFLSLGEFSSVRQLHKYIRFNITLKLSCLIIITLRLNHLHTLKKSLCFAITLNCSTSFSMFVFSSCEDRISFDSQCGTVRNFRNVLETWSNIIISSSIKHKRLNALAIFLSSKLSKTVNWNRLFL